MDRVSPDSIFSTSGFTHQAAPTNQQHPSLNRGRLSDPVSPSPSPASSQQQPEKRFNLHNRRLQLRNAGFRAAPLPNRRISAQLSRWRTPSGETIEPEEDKENNTSGSGSARVSSPNSATAEIQSRDSRGRGSSKKVNILQEISYSTQRRRKHSPRPSVAGLFQNCLDIEPPAVDQSTPPPIQRRVASLEPALELESPINTDPFDIMRSRENIPISENSSPQINDSLGRNSLRAQNKRRAGLRSSSAEASRYIEHLETQLAASISQVEALKEPPTKPQIAKLKMLTEECKILKQELEEWQTRFEARVNEEVESRAGDESDSRKKIAALEREMEIKDRKINELEWEIETMTQKLRNFQSLDTTNRNLERRVDVLTGLLAQSPTRAESGFSPRRGDMTSPTRERNSTRPRPRSMMPRIPPMSPEKDSMFQPLMAPRTDPYEDSPHSMVSPSGPPRSNRESRDMTASEMSTADRTIPELSSLYTGASDTFSLSSDPTSVSQRSSMISQSSSSLGLPLLFSPENQARLQNRNRKMRRFPSGSSSLKPLVLPTSAVTMPMPPYYPRCQSTQSSPPNDILSNDFNHSGFSPEVPYQQRRRPCPVQEEDSLNALEGRSNYYQSFEEAIAGHRTSEMGLNSDNFDDALYDSPPGNSSTEEDVTAFFNGDYDATQRLDVSRGLNTKQNLLSDELPHLSPTYSSYNLDPKSSVSKAFLDQHRRRIDRDITPRPMKALPQSGQSPKCALTPGAASGYTLGIISNYSYFSQIGRNHMDLARRIILRAWKSNWKRLGRLSWWVLGIVVGSQTRDRWFRSSVLGKDFDWHGCSSGAVGDGGTQPRTELANGTETRLASRSSGIRPVGQVGDGMSEPPAPARFPLGQSACLWARFSLALVFAIGLAFKDGPGTLLIDRVEEKIYSDDPNRITPAGPGDTEDFNSSVNGPPPSITMHPDPPPHDPCGGENSPASQAAEQTLTWTRNLGIEDFMTV